MIEFFIRNYSGSKKYFIGIPDIPNVDGYHYMNWMNYAEASEEGLWSTRYNNNLNSEMPDFIEITEDNGKFIKGVFSFVGHNVDGNSFLSVTNGDFNVKMDY